MTDEHLRDRLAAADPSADPMDPVTSDRARALMEDIMSIPTVQTPTSAGRPYRLVAAVAAALVVVIGGAALFARTGSSDAPPLVLTAEGGDALASCMPFEVSTLAGMSPAFAGTVVELTDSVATLEVDRWFTGGDAETVEVRYTPGFEALIGTPALEIGQRYLMTATEGVVNGCGYSGPATPEYEAAFERAFDA
ncbi:MAG TPA: hypothetical protein VHL52_07500 [Acidimicrobiia bacterium]|nr:hypothetical protein [Acidimicrobiia bacterium]